MSRSVLAIVTEHINGGGTKCNGYFADPIMQCAADRTHWSLIKLPPQKCPFHSDDETCKETIHGQL